MISQDLHFTASRTKFLNSIEIFRDLSSPQTGLFENILENQTIKRGGIIFREDDTDDCLYLVKEGKVTLRFSMTVNTGTIRPIVMTVYENGFFGELEFMDSLSRKATAVAEEDTELIKLRREGFFNIIDTNPDIACIVMKNFNKLLTSRIRRSDRQLKIALTMGWNAYRFDKY